MSDPQRDPIEVFLGELARGLRRVPTLRDRMLEEVREHLEEAVAERRQDGLDADAAARAAVERFGSPRCGVPRRRARVRADHRSDEPRRVDVADEGRARPLGPHPQWHRARAARLARSDDALTGRHGRPATDRPHAGPRRPSPRGRPPRSGRPAPRDRRQRRDRDLRVAAAAPHRDAAVRPVDPSPRAARGRAARRRAERGPRGGLARGRAHRAARTAPGPALREPHHLAHAGRGGHGHATGGATQGRPAGHGAGVRLRRRPPRRARLPRWSRDPARGGRLDRAGVDRAGRPALRRPGTGDGRDPQGRRTGRGDRRGSRARGCLRSRPRRFRGSRGGSPATARTSSSSATSSSCRGSPRTARVSARARA